MSDDDILADEADGIRRITLNRPKAKNALALEAQHTARRSFDPLAFGQRGRDTAGRSQTKAGKTP